MSLVSNIPAPTSRLEETPLPWWHFEFRQPHSPLSPHANPDAVHALSFDGHTIPFKILRTANAPNRPALVLLHGMGLTIASFRGIAPFLLPTHDLILVDYSSLSLTHAPLPDYTSFKAFATAVWRLADRLGLPKISLAGNSLGGGLSLMATLLAPHRVDRLLLSNPACFPQPLPRTYRYARIPLFGDLLMSFTAPERLIGGIEYIGYVDKTRFHPTLRAIYMANMASPRNRRRLMQLIRQLPANDTDTASQNHLPRLSTIRNPVLISFGTKDPLLVEGAGERLAALLPNVTYDPHPDLAHMPHEEAPDRLGPRWAQFLNPQLKQLTTDN